MSESTGDATDTGDWREIRVLALPLALHARSQEHSEELQREFALLSMSQDTSAVPRRLRELVERLTAHYGEASVAADDEREAAMARGDRTVDLTYRLPAAVADACVELGYMLDECDDFCREGDALLTLATPPEAVAYRRWFLDQFIDQVRDGADPVPWSDELLTSAPHPRWTSRQS